MFHKFAEYEIIRISSNSKTAAVRGWQVGSDSQVVYIVRLPNGELLQALENDLEATGQFEAPFRVYEVVEIYPVDLTTEPDVTNLIGKRAVVTSIASNDDSKHWGFSVAIQNGERWHFEDHELRATGIFLSHDELFGQGEGTFLARVSFDTGTGEETVLAGDGALINRGPRPLRINLEALSA